MASPSERATTSRTRRDGGTPLARAYRDPRRPATLAHGRADPSRTMSLRRTGVWTFLAVGASAALAHVAPYQVPACGRAVAVVRLPAATWPGRAREREHLPMDMTGEYRIPAPRQRVWEALNDPEMLRQAIPGCEQLRSAARSSRRGHAKVGPVKREVPARSRSGDLNRPKGYSISGEGKGGAAGFAKGGAKVDLTEEGTDTVLRYEAKADVGGKLAQIGSRLIQGTAKKMADDFFGRFSRIVAESYAGDRRPRRHRRPRLPGRRRPRRWPPWTRCRRPGPARDARDHRRRRAAGPAAGDAAGGPVTILHQPAAGGRARGGAGHRPADHQRRGRATAARRPTCRPSRPVAEPPRPAPAAAARAPRVRDP